MKVVRNIPGSSRQETIGTTSLHYTRGTAAILGGRKWRFVEYWDRDAEGRPVRELRLEVPDGGDPTKLPNWAPA